MTDSIINKNDSIDESNTMAKESYNFTYSESELKEIHKTINAPRRIAFIIVLFGFFWGIINGIISSTPLELTYVWIVIWMIFLILFTITEIREHKAYKKNTQKVLSSTYLYEVYDKYFTATVKHNDEITVHKIYFDKITRIIPREKQILVVFEKRIFIIEKENLPNNSPLLHLQYIKKMHYDKSKAKGKEKAISLVLFIITLCLPHGTLILANIIAIFIYNSIDLFSGMWVGFCLLPIPIISIIYGFYLKKKGYSNYKKNIIAGAIVTYFVFVLSIASTIAY